MKKKNIPNTWRLPIILGIFSPRQKYLCSNNLQNAMLPKL